MTAHTTAVRSNSRRFPFGKIFAWIGVALLLFVTIFPFYWVLRTALTSPDMVYTNSTSLLPVEPTLFNFARVLGLVDLQASQSAGGSGQTLDFFLYLRNSFIVATSIAIGQVIFSSMAAYAFARLNFPLRDQIFYIYIAALMVPAIVTLIPNFILMRQLGWLNTFAGIIAPYFLMTPFAVFFLRQFFLGVNREIEEAAKIDGASIFKIYWKVVLPISRPPLFTLGIITFIQSWNEYLWPLIVGKQESVRVLTVALGIFRQQTPGGGPDWSGLMAGTTLAIIPTLVLFLILGRQVLDSIQFTGFK